MEGRIICVQDLSSTFDGTFLWKYPICSKRANVWMHKRIKGFGMESCMDKFIALYIAYAALVASFKNEKTKDLQCCTCCVYKIIKNTGIENKINDDAIELGRSIFNHPFSVLSSNGEYPHLYINWTENKDKRLLSLLETLYFMRCNLFHGNKNLEVAQIEILKPAIACLKEICKVLDGELKKNTKINY